MCGGDIHGYSGQITSPNYPNNYDNHTNCTWNITVPEGFRVLLHFRNFTLHKDDGDYVQVHFNIIYYIRI